MNCEMLEKKLATPSKLKISSANFPRISRSKKTEPPSVLRSVKHDEGNRHEKKSPSVLGSDVKVDYFIVTSSCAISIDYI